MSLYTNGNPTRFEVEEVLANSVGTTSQAVKFVEVEDVPAQWKHSCTPTGVGVLASYSLQIGTVFVQYAFCPVCRKILYHKEAGY